MALAFTASGQSQTIAVSETGFGGTFSQTNSCAGIASIAAASGGFAVTAQAAGTCFGTISDGQGNTAHIGITVTTTGFTLNAARRH
jgi:hypothetical protein